MVDTATVKKVAFLSRLKIEENKLDSFCAEFNTILNWMKDLEEVNTECVEPLVSVNREYLTCRKDEILEGNQSCKILKNAPTHEHGYFVVPKVIE